MKLFFDWVVMPWRPHFNFRAGEKTLEDVVGENKTISALEAQGRLLWYNLSTSKKHNTLSTIVVTVAYFSAEAAIRLLAIAGVRKMRTLGIDGGNRYAEEFKDITPFRGAHKTSDLQTPEINGWT